jgi:hypothetical protein
MEPAQPTQPQDPEASAATLPDGAGAGQTRLEVLAKAAQFTATGNPIFAWDCIRAATSLRAAMRPVELPPAVGNYLHEAAKAISLAGVGPPASFSKEALRALGFGGTRSASTAKSYGKHQGAGVLLSIYRSLKARHGSARAEEIMAQAVNVTDVSMRRWLIEARDSLTAALKAAGQEAVDRASLGMNFEPELPDAILLQFLRGLPNQIWRGRGSSGRSEPRTK